MAEEANQGCRSYGVNFYSAVLKYDFDVINCTPQDPMHIIFEGVLRKLITKIFSIWLDLKRTNLSEINHRLASQFYGYTHSKNRIAFLNPNDLVKKDLVISASQMHTLIILFPIIFYDILDPDNEFHELINLARSITMIATAFYLNQTLINQLSDSISKFITKWIAMGYESFPKLHYMVHIPTAIQK